MSLDITSYILGKKKGGGGTGPNLQSKTVTITQNGTTTVSPDAGYDGLSSVQANVNVPSSGSDLHDYFTYTISRGDTTNGSGVQFTIKSIPEDTVVVGNDLAYAFYMCSALESLPLIDTSSVTQFNGCFWNCSNLESVAQIDTSNAMTFTNMFIGCTKLESIPQLNTSRGTNMVNMFRNCTSLTTVPVLNTSALQGGGHESMFFGCPNLTDESLNNILTMCINMSNQGTYRQKLSYLGFTATDYPVSRIQALSNYQAFINAGWTIGYE